MILLTKLEVENFGPYRTEQTVDLGKTINIIEGENGTGKTNLFEALRFALYGATGGSGENVDPGEFLNEAGRKAGELCFRTTITFTFEDGGTTRTGEAIREYCTNREGPQTEVIVAVDEDVLPVLDGEELLTRLFPPKLASFYFFNAEMLRQYQAAAVDGDGRTAVPETIERLLGIPAVDNCGTDISEVGTQAAKKIAAVDFQNENLQFLSSKLTMAHEQEQSWEGQLQLAREDRQTIEGNLDKVEADLAKYDDYAEFKKEISVLNADRQTSQQQAAEARARIAELASSAWIGVVEEDLKRRRKELQSDLESAALMFGRHTVYVEHHDHLVADPTCPTCAKTLTVDERDSTVGRISREIAQTSPEDLQASLSMVSATIRRIQDILDRGASAELRDRALSITAANVADRDTKTKIDQVEKRMEGTGLHDESYQDLVKAKLDLRQQDALARDAIEEAQGERDEAQIARRKLERQVEEAAGAVVPAEVRALSRATRVLESIFADAASHARTLIQGEIEAKAEEYFRRVSSNPGYDGLRLGDGYRVTIVGEDGEPVVHPSSGYEHLVVLSLASAVMRTSPTPGPVVMDMPFGRLDKSRTSQVVQALPQLSDQIVLFVFPGEFDQEDLNALGEQVYAVYDIDRHSWDHSDVTRRRVLDREATR